jgi:hypothetical protein
MSCSVLRRLQGASTRSIEKLPLLAVDLDGHLLGLALGPAVDEDLGDVALHEVERAHEHALRVEAVLVEVVLAHVEQRLREDRELREVVLAGPAPTAAASWLSAPTRMPSPPCRT